MVYKASRNARRLRSDAEVTWRKVRCDDPRLHEDASADRLSRVAIEKGMRLLKDDGSRQIRADVNTAEEVWRVADVCEPAVRLPIRLHDPIEPVTPFTRGRLMALRI